VQKAYDDPTYGLEIAALYLDIVKRGPASGIEGLVRGAVLRRHDDAGGLVDDGPPGQGAAQMEMAAPPADPTGAR
jgi:hypothetical protein